MHAPSPVVLQVDVPSLQLSTTSKEIPPALRSCRVRAGSANA